MWRKRQPRRSPATAASRPPFATISLTLTGILHAGAVFDTNGDYVAAAGTYMLKLIAKGNDGGCVGNATFFRPSLGYMLVGS